MNLSSQIPFSLFSGPLGEDIIGPDGVTVRAVLQFRDAISSMGRQYQYLELEVESDTEWAMQSFIMARGVRWRVTQRLLSTYTGSVKYTASND